MAYGRGGMGWMGVARWMGWMEFMGWRGARKEKRAAKKMFPLYGKLFSAARGAGEDPLAHLLDLLAPGGGIGAEVEELAV